MKKLLSIILLGLIFSSCAHKNSAYTPEQQALHEKIKAALDSNTFKFRSCYQSELDKSKKPKDLEGSIELKFNVGEEGKVLSSDVTSKDVKDGITLRCMKIILDEIQFPRPIEGKSYDVFQPVNLRPINK